MERRIRLDDKTTVRKLVNNRVIVEINGVRELVLIGKYTTIADGFTPSDYALLTTGGYQIIVHAQSSDLPLKGSQQSSTITPNKQQPNAAHRAKYGWDVGDVVNIIGKKSLHIVIEVGKTHSIVGKKNGHILSSAPFKVDNCLVKPVHTINHDIKVKY